MGGVITSASNEEQLRQLGPRDGGPNHLGFATILSP